MTPTPIAGHRKPASLAKRGRTGFVVITALAVLAACGLAVASAGDRQASQGAVVQNVRTEQIGGSTVRILYDLYSTDPTAIVEIAAEASVDGGKTYGVKLKSVLGDVGRGVKSGLSKSILWDARKDLGDFRFELIKARVSVVTEGSPVAPPTPVAPAPAAPTSARGTIVVTSQPGDATVTVDGTWRGLTPSEIRELPGPHRVLVTKPGYFDNSRVVDVRAGGREEVVVTLTPLSGAAVAPAARAQDDPTPAGQAPAKGTIAVASLPVEATVAIDGISRGVTPLEITELPGSHRVLVTKSGYLDNARVVDVRAGSKVVVDVTLTPMAPAAPTPVASPARTAPTPASPSQPQIQPKKKGSALKWILIGGGVVAVGGGLAISGVLTPNKAPVAGSVNVSPTGTGLSGATVFTFTSSGASDPDGDPLTYTWDFGDGGNGTGATATHVFSSAGTYTVTVTVSDGKKSATATASTLVRNVSGTWRGQIYVTVCGDQWLTWTLTQTGSSISGSHTDPVNGFRTITGTVSNPRNMTITLSSGVVYTGTLNSDLSQYSGSVTGYGGGTGNFCIAR